MLKILNTDQIREWDSFTIENEGIASIDLMERACLEFVKWFVEKFDPDQRVAVVCGTGNNGGDGLGIARLLSERGHKIDVWVIRGGVGESPDFLLNFNRLPEEVSCFEIKGKCAPETFSSYSILIDGIFGSGLNRPAEGIYQEVITIMNSTSASRISIDIPSGMFADKHSEGTVLRADFTVTFQLPKLAFFVPESGRKVGVWSSVDIKLSKSFLERTETCYFLTTRTAISKLIRERDRFAHKGTFGKALIVAGSQGKMGACVLAAKAAMRAGVGLLTVHIPKIGYSIVQTAVPEAMATVDPDENVLSVVPEHEGSTAVGVGPGLGQDAKSVLALGQLLEQTKRPLVIDADGLNILAANRELLHLVPTGSILTPHGGELERLVGVSTNGFEQLDRARSLATQLKSFIVLKGANTAVVSPEGKVYFNSTGNAGMATGGSGDVLTGVLTSLLAQSYTSSEAAMLGVYIHGLAGDLAAYEKGQQSLIASDIVDYLPQAIKKLTIHQKKSFSG
ncbi:MAG: NAD(P)H-hydrate dehydratase [Cytophagales bacterium]